MKKNWFRIVLFICLAMSILAQQSYAARDKIILAFGDSITEGLWEVEPHDPGDRVGGYEPDLEVLTDNINNHYDVLNYGFSGERTVYVSSKPNYPGGWPRLRDSVLPLHPNAEYILIMEGTNDIWSQIPRDTTKQALGYMIDEAKSYGIIPLIGTLTPDLRPGVSDYKNVPDYNVRIRNLAEEKGITLADFYPQMLADWSSTYVSNDDLHPQRAGYAKMAEIWFEALALPEYLAMPWMKLLLDN